MTNETSGTGTNMALDDRLAVLATNMDDMFLIVNGIFISLMQAGFACLEAGCVNSKNVTNIMMKNVLDLFICSIIYWLIGYSLSYSPGNAFLGYTQWAAVGMAPTSYAHWFFQFIFAATAATIISGAVAERCNFVAYLVYSSTVSGFVYPVVAHWAWGEGGFLGTMGYKDFAGSGVVHLMAGVCSFVAAALIGPRIGKFENGVPVDKPGHSTPLLGLGGLLLVTGFLAFNGGSLGHISQPGDGAVVAKAIINSILGGSGAGLVILALCRSGLVGPPAWSFGAALNAILTGIVAMCAGANTFTFVGALISGACACLVYLLLRSVVLYLRVDDPLDAVAVHFGGGIWGLIALPVFGEGGVVYGLNETSVADLWHNVIGAVIITVWSLVCSLVIFGGLRVTGFLRVTEEEEMEGLDVSKHNEPAYPLGGWHLTYPLQMHSHPTFHKNGSYTLDRESPALAFDNIALEMDTCQRQR